MIKTAAEKQLYTRARLGRVLRRWGWEFDSEKNAVDAAQSDRLVEAALIAAIGEDISTAGDKLNSISFDLDRIAEALCREDDRAALDARSHARGVTTLCVPGSLGLGLHHYTGPDPIPDMPLDDADLDLSIRARKALVRRDIKTLRQFMSLSRDDVLSMRGAGATTANEIYAIQDAIRHQYRIPAPAQQP